MSEYKSIRPEDHATRRSVHLRPGANTPSDLADIFQRIARKDRLIHSQWNVEGSDGNKREVNVALDEA